MDVRAPIWIYSDSQGSIALSKNPEYHARTKHIDIQHHFVREHVSNGNVIFSYVSTDNMAADILTKSLAREKHHKFLKELGLSDGK